MGDASETVSIPEGCRQGLTRLSKCTPATLSPAATRVTAPVPSFRFQPAIVTPAASGFQIGRSEETARSAPDESLPRAAHGYGAGTFRILLWVFGRVGRDISDKHHYWCNLMSTKVCWLSHQYCRACLCVSLLLNRYFTIKDALTCTSSVVMVRTSSQHGGCPLSASQAFTHCRSSYARRNWEDFSVSIVISRSQGIPGSAGRCCRLRNALTPSPETVGTSDVLISPLYVIGNKFVSVLPDRISPTAPVLITGDRNKVVTHLPMVIW